MSVDANTVFIGTRGSRHIEGNLAPVVQGSTESVHTITVKYADDTVYNLAGAAITGTFSRRGETFAITGALTVTDAANGVFTWAKTDADVGQAGTFDVQFVITAADSDTDATFEAPMTVEPLAEADTIVPGDVIDGGSAGTLPITEIDGGDA